MADRNRPPVPDVRRHKRQDFGDRVISDVANQAAAIDQLGRGELRQVAIHRDGVPAVGRVGEYQVHGVVCDNVRMFAKVASDDARVDAVHHRQITRILIGCLYAAKFGVVAVDVAGLVHFLDQLAEAIRILLCGLDDGLCLCECATGYAERCGDLVRVLPRSDPVEIFPRVMRCFASSRSRSSTVAAMATISDGVKSLRYTFSASSPKQMASMSTTWTGTSVQPSRLQASNRRSPATSSSFGLITMGCRTPSVAILLER